MATLTMFVGAWCWLTLFAVCSAEKWRFPDTAESVRIDSKLSFSDSPFTANQNTPPSREGFKNVESDDILFRERLENQASFSKPSYAGHFAGSARPNDLNRYSSNNQQRNKYKYPAEFSQEKPVYESDGTLDSLQVCKCSRNVQQDCPKHVSNTRTCGPNMHLCCYDDRKSQQSQYFNDLTDEHPLLLPGQGPTGGPFPAPPDTLMSGQFGPGHAQESAMVAGLGPSRAPLSGILVGPQGPKSIFGPALQSKAPPVLVGPNGPTGIIGPLKKPGFTGFEPNGNPYDDADSSNYNDRPILLGPDGPTGMIGPNKPSVLVGPGGPTGLIGPNTRPGENYNRRPVLVGPDGPTGVIGTQKPSVLVGPGRPTGIIGPNIRPNDNYNGKPVLVGPEGPTGNIGPNYGPGLGSYREPEEESPSETAQRPVLVGPGGPTGIIGPGFNQRPILVGPGGPTGIIGPRRPVLVGPGGPTGIIGPGYGLSGRGSRRPILVGPGGPTGMIGPYGYYGK